MFPPLYFRPNNPQFVLARMLCGLHNQSGPYGEEKDLLPLQGIELLLLDIYNCTYTTQ
jgi:hypothetical protein